MSEARFDYELIDSGGGTKLERLGEYRLVRPSSLAIWARGLDDKAWGEADAEFVPGKGWGFNGKRLEAWQLQLGGVRAWVRLQSNGQIGVFPEHQLYMIELEREIMQRSVKAAQPPKVLNLFAYTGVFSCFAAKLGAEVCHVDISKKVLDWARENIELNQVPDGMVRLIPEDAVKFVQRERRRGSRYEIIVADPPSFSRVSSNKDWKLEDVLAPFLADLVQLLDPAVGVLYLTSHYTELGPTVFLNLIRDVAPSCWNLSARELTIQEHSGKHALPAGFLITVRASA